MAIIKGAEQYMLYSSKKGILLIHGFTGSPAEMRPLAEYMHKRNYTVSVPLLPGHGTTADDLAQRRWPEWYSQVEKSYYELQGICEEVYVAGISMGGLLALKLASEHPVKKLAVMSVPIKLRDKRAFLVPFVALFRPFIPKARRKYTIASQYNISYHKYPLKAVNSLLHLIGEVKRKLSSINVPTLIVQSRTEKTVAPESADFIFNNIASKEKVLMWLENSGHMVILDQEREQVYKAVDEFFEGESDGH